MSTKKENMPNASKKNLFLMDHCTRGS